MTVEQDLVRVERLDELVELLDALDEPAYVRFSAGPALDVGHPSIDGESGLLLPGLSASRLRAEPWWDRPAREWVARKVCQYAHLARDGRFAWVLTGREVGRGPDSEPLLADVVPVARLGEALLEEADAVYRTVFTPGRMPG